MLRFGSPSPETWWLYLVIAAMHGQPGLAGAGKGGPERIQRRGL